MNDQSQVSSAERVITLPFGLELLRKLPIPHKLGVLERLYGKALGKNEVCWVKTASNTIWKLNLRDGCARWMVYGDYEGSNQMTWVRNWLANGGVVVDSGANIGQFTHYFGSMSDVEVLAFEPLPEAAEWLKECLDNYPDWKVELIRAGLSDSQKVLEVQVDGARSTARLDWYKGKDFRHIEVPVFRLDDALNERGIERVRLWKLDVEGHEVSALQGASSLLQNRRIDAILVEISDQATVECLKDSGYSVYKIIDGALQHQEPGQIQGNRVAMPSNTLA